MRHAVSSDLANHFESTPLYECYEKDRLSDSQTNAKNPDGAGKSLFSTTELTNNQRIKS